MSPFFTLRQWNNSVIQLFLQCFVAVREQLPVKYAFDSRVGYKTIEAVGGNCHWKTKLVNARKISTSDVEELIDCA